MHILFKNHLTNRVLFSRTDLLYTDVKPEVKEDTKAKPRACEILEKKQKFLKVFALPMVPVSWDLFSILVIVVKDCPPVTLAQWRLQSM
jgi:hypothetical protein